MSSVSSFEGSDKDSFFQKSFQDNPALARHSYLRKTDLLDTLDNGRTRDTDTWSVAATIDDQESVISTHAASINRLNHDRETDDDNNTVDDVRDQLQDAHLREAPNLRDIVGHPPLDEEDKQSRSNAAEFGDARSSVTFEHSAADSSDGEPNDVVDDQISAPPQPQPSFASVVNKSYAELMEENELLQAQLRSLQSAQKHQAEMIMNLKNLTGCDEEVYGKALALSQMKNDEFAATAGPSVINSRTLTQKLARLAETLSRFVTMAAAVVNKDEAWRLSLEQSLYSQITQLYLTSLPFGTENQHLLNTAYLDQICRFETTLGSNFAKWYRKQTVQSLTLNPATKEYLQDIQRHVTKKMLGLLDTDCMDDELMRIWDYILELCASLSLEIHRGDADVSVEHLQIGSKYDQDIMAPTDNISDYKNKLVKMSISPLFIDEEGVVLLPARVDMKEVKRRYSEFESLRKSLVRLYPVLLIPPIPEKHTLSEYTRKDENNAMIDKRKRMLERFLVRIGVHPILSQEHVFHRFIHGNESWNDVLSSPPLSDLPKDHLIPNDYASLTHTSVIPVPSSSYIIKHPHQEFEQAESNVDKSTRDKGHKFDKSQKNILKRLTDLSNDYSDLGSVYNALSLYEPSGLLSSFIEKLGQVIDDSCASTNDMIKSLEIECSEHIQDYSQYLQITKQALRYRRMKQAQLELIQETLDQKTQALETLLRKQDESNKLKTGMNQLSISKSAEEQEEEDEVDDDFLDTESIEDGFAAIIKEDIGNKKHTAEEAHEYPASATLSTVKSSKERTKKWTSTKKLFSAFSFTFQGMIDSDPEQTRQNQILKSKDTIKQLEKARESVSQDLSEMSDMLQQELKRHKAQQDKELKLILIAFAKIHLSYCERNMICWKKIRNEVDISINKLN
ncbi:hypothetical protein G6F24_004895 [Rhizopus arrhizus]|nr:hypothetical protein G6F24_004895 [Rhizopus arrhizus]